MAASTSVVIDDSAGFPVAVDPQASVGQPDRSWLALVTALFALVALAWATNLVLRELPGFGLARVGGALLYGSDAAG